MATYAELLSASESPTLNNKVRVAVVIGAETVRNESTGVANHAARMQWAKAAFMNPDIVARSMIWALLAQNSTMASSTILAASDNAVQTAVNAAIDVFAST